MMQVLFILIMCVFHFIWVGCLAVCQTYQVVWLAMTTNERMNAARYKHFQRGEWFVLDIQHVVNVLCLSEQRSPQVALCFGTLRLRPSKMDWTKQFSVPGPHQDLAEDTESLLSDYQLVWPQGGQAADQVISPTVASYLLFIGSKLPKRFSGKCVRELCNIRANFVQNCFICISWHTFKFVYSVCTSTYLIRQLIRHTQNKFLDF